jgi:hypothetical protein
MVFVLLVHIVAAVASLAALPVHYILARQQSRWTGTAHRILVGSPIITALSGFALILEGASITNTCVILACYLAFMAATIKISDTLLLAKNSSL